MEIAGYRVLKKPAKFAALLALVAPMLLSACGGGNTPTSGTSGPGQATAGATTGTSPSDTSTRNAAAGGGGTLRWSNEGISELDTLDPPKTQSSNSTMVCNLIFE